MYRHAFLSTVVVCLLAAPAWGQTDNPTAEGMKAPPSCQVQLATCKNTLISTQGQLAVCKNTGKTTKTKLAICANDLEDCRTDLDACEAEPRVVLPGDGDPTTPEEKAVGIDHGPALSYTDHGDGTITDNNTRLMWEKKDREEGSVHNLGNGYQWSSNSIDPIAPDGSLFTVFLATLNTAPCFANHCDWRIPNIRELTSIVNHTAAIPATSLPGLRNTTPANCWSSTTFGFEFEGYAWIVLFESGLTYYEGKLQSVHAIAVRGGQ